MSFKGVRNAITMKSSTNEKALIMFNYSLHDNILKNCDMEMIKIGPTINLAQYDNKMNDLIRNFIDD